MKHFFILTLFCVSNLFAQNLDSLYSVAKSMPDDTNKVNLLNKVSRAELSISNFDKCATIAAEAKYIAEKLHFNVGLGSSLLNIGFSYNEQGYYPQALEQFSSALKIFEKADYKIGISKTYNNIGITYFHQGNYPEALKMHFSALKIKESLNDEIGMASSYGNIGLIYSNQGNYTDALKNYSLGLEIAKKYNKQGLISNFYTNIGQTYYHQKNYSQALKTDSIALKINEKIGDKQAIAALYNNIGLIFLDQKKYKQALDVALASLKIKEEINDQEGMISSYNNLGALYLETKKASIGKEWYLKALKLSFNIDSKDDLKYTYLGLAKADSALGNYKEAFTNYKLFTIYKDSLINEDNTKKTVQIQMQYEFDKKETLAKQEQEKKNAIAQEEKQKQRVILILVSCFLVMLAIFAGFMYNRFKITKRQKVIIEQKELETRNQKQVIEEKQKEIVDSISYAKRLQEAILPPQEFVSTHLSNNFIYYQPKDIVAGDFYWAEKVDDLFFIAAADSTGHGVPGAMVSVVCSNSLNRTVKEFALTDTGKILDKTRELVVETFAKSNSEVKDGMDISLLCFDKQNHKIFWSGANNPLWYIENNELKEIKADKQAIGKTDNPKPFTTHEIEYKNNTTFYLFTDGLPDQFGGPQGKKFKYKQFEQLLTSINDKTMQEQSDIINQKFEDWKGELEQVDDICVIGIKI
ncbi:MAG TPA: tetratricopeptide repeat protein [Bacteroidia bacterium]|nr:tetratricopeptide repeat protein [Bacteroidia bacterium]